jgi:hypothetical protein
MKARESVSECLGMWECSCVEWVRESEWVRVKVRTPFYWRRWDSCFGITSIYVKDEK